MPSAQCLSAETTSHHARRSFRCPVTPLRSLRRWLRDWLVTSLRRSPHGILLAAVGWVVLVAVDDGLAEESLSPAIQAMVRHASRSPDGSAAFTFDPRAFDGELRDLPIGLFDSGIGGLTVLEAILSLDAYDNHTLLPGPDGRPDFEGERFIYFGDQANMPYGNYPREGNEAYLRELILKDTVFLLGRRYWPSPEAAAPRFDKPPVKAIVIGCNTATAYGLDDIRAAIQHWNIPVFVVGVVEAGARGVLETRPESGEQEQAIAVLATVGTCNSQAYPQAIAAAFDRAGQPGPAVIQQGFAELAAAIEGDPEYTAAKSVEQYIAADIGELMNDYRQSGRTQPVGRIVLGCTHFPLVQEQIVAELAALRRQQADGEHPYERLIAARVEVIDPAELTAKQLFRLLTRHRLHSRRSADAADQPSHRFFVTVPQESERGVRLAGDGSLQHQYKYGRVPGRLDIEDTRVVPLAMELIPETSINLIRTRLPHVWESLSGGLELPPSSVQPSGNGCCRGETSCAPQPQRNPKR